MAICESCGRDEAALTKVQRVYLVPGAENETGDGPGAGPGVEQPPAQIEGSATATAGDIELWCSACCATFPHVIIDAA
jgi:hypothetical protein